MNLENRISYPLMNIHIHIFVKLSFYNHSYSHYVDNFFIFDVQNLHLKKNEIYYRINMAAFFAVYLCAKRELSKCLAGPKVKSHLCMHDSILHLNPNIITNRRDSIFLWKISRNTGTKSTKLSEENIICLT